MNRLEVELESSRKARTTSRFLRVLTFQIVKRALTEHFGENYSDCCLQSSVAIKQVLEEFGIKASLIKGGVCLPWVTKGERFGGGWHGFWDANHHFWIVTEFGEYVDLTIAQINLHRASPHPDWVDPYPVWTSDNIFLSNVFLYLPKAPARVGLVGEAIDDLDRFLLSVHRHRESFVASASSNPVRDFDSTMTILEGMPTCEALSRVRDEWAEKTRIVIESREPLPDWVENEIQNLRKSLPQTR